MTNTRLFQTGTWSGRAAAALGVAAIAACGGGYGGGGGGGGGGMGSSAPVISLQPASQTVPAPTMATFTVRATGYGTLSYQWMRNGMAINMATASMYTTPPTSAADSGTTFAVRITNMYGSVTSNAATLTVM